MALLCSGCKILPMNAAITGHKAPEVAQILLTWMALKLSATQATRVEASPAMRKDAVTNPSPDCVPRFVAWNTASPAPAAPAAIRRKPGEPELPLSVMRGLKDIKTSAVGTKVDAKTEMPNPATYGR